MGNLPYLCYHNLRELKFFLFSLLLLLPGIGDAQLLKTAWDRDYGGNIWEDCNSVAETADGGFLMGGYTSSTVTPMGDVSDPPFDGFFPPPDVGDYWIVKTDADGLIEWDRRYGGNKQDRLWAAQQTPEGGFILGGVSNSDNGLQKSGFNRGDEDYWIIKTDASGAIEWDSTYGGDSTDYFYSLLQTSDGGYLLGGISRSDIGNEKTDNHRGDFDMWIIKVDANGTIVWDKTIGGVEEERLNEMQEGPDGHYWIAGSTASDMDGIDVLQPGYGGKDFWFIKLDSLDGSKLEEFRFGGSDEDEIQSFEQTQDGGFLLGGGSRSGVSALKKEASQWVDFWIVKIDALGTIEWEETFGGPELENCYSVKQNDIGNYLVGGYSASGIGPDKTEGNRGVVGTEDFWLLYLAPDGTKLWDKTLGGSSRDVLENLFQSSDGGYVLAGHSSSVISGDKTTENKGLNDFWIIKTLCNVSVEFNDTIVCPNSEVLLNATDTNCVLCSWRWEDNTIDSVRQLTISQNSTYSVTLVDGVGCSWSDDIQIDVYIPPALDLGSNQELCEGASTTLSPGIPNVQYDWSTGESSPSITIDTTGVYQLVVTDSNTCTAADSMELLIHPLPIVDLGNDTSFCAGQNITLDAGNPGASYQWQPFVHFSQILTATPQVPGTISVTVTDVHNCVAVDSLSILQLYTKPEAIDVQLECNSLNTGYTVSFHITGGNPGSYVVNGLPGTLAGDLFISDLIPKDQNFNFTIDDINACGPDQISGTYDCACVTDAGRLTPNPIRICGTEIISLPHTGSVLDNDDVLEFLLHDGDANTIGTILLRQNNPVFQFQAPLVYGITYYVVAIAGNNDNGSVNQQDGCLSQSNGVPIVFYENPIALIIPEMGTQITCAHPFIPLSATSSQPFGQLDFNWFAFDGGNITTAPNSPVVEVNEAGTYMLVVTDRISGCTAEESLVVETDEGVPNIVIAQPEVYTCRDTLITLDATGSSFGAPYSTIWYGGNIDGTSGLQVLVNAPGAYTLQITNGDNGCVVDQMVTVAADTTGPLIDAGPRGLLDCIHYEAELIGSISSDCNNCTFEWITRDGHFIAGLNSLNPLVDLEGTYVLSVYDPASGCTAQDEVMVIEDPEVPRSADLTVQSPPCFGDDEGTIRVEAVQGGEPPYRYSLDGEDYSESGDYPLLPPGSYSLFIQDAKGCEWDTLIYLSEALPLQVSLGDDQLIDLGEAIRLTAVANRPVDSFLWNHPEMIDCEVCRQVVVSPVEETIFEVTVVDQAGCRAVDELTISVRKNREVFIPSAFSGDFNGVNDYFTVFAGASVRQINFLRVYSRWGELVFERENFAPNQEVFGWDGTMRGKDMDTGIYVYVAEIEFIDGLSLIYKGDVLLAK